MGIAGELIGTPTMIMLALRWAQDVCDRQGTGDMVRPALQAAEAAQAVVGVRKFQEEGQFGLRVRAMQRAQLLRDGLGTPAEMAQRRGTPLWIAYMAAGAVAGGRPIDAEHAMTEILDRAEDDDRRVNELVRGRELLATLLAEARDGAAWARSWRGEAL